MYYELLPLLLIAGLALFALAVILVRIWAIRKRNYWKSQDVPYIDSPLILGHFSRSFILKKPITDTCNEIYNHADALDKPFIGVNVFHKPALFIRDPVLVRRILTVDGSYFGDG